MLSFKNGLHGQKGCCHALHPHHSKLIQNRWLVIGSKQLRPHPHQTNQHLWKLTTHVELMDKSWTPILSFGFFILAVELSMIGNSLMTADELSHYITNLDNDFVSFIMQNQVMVPFSRFYYFLFGGSSWSDRISDFLNVAKINTVVWL